MGEAQNFLKIKHTEYASPPMFALKKAVVSTQCPRTDLKDYHSTDLPQHETLYPIDLKSARIEIPHI